MPILVMERGRKKLQNVLEDGLSSDLMNAGRFCFSCEQIFTDRKCLEEHLCSAASYICSCGTEFTQYGDMQEHSTTHEPGHQVLDHKTIRKRRIEKRIEEEEQLKRLQTGEVVWRTPKSNNGLSASLSGKPMMKAPMTSTHMPQVPIQSAKITQVPQWYTSVSQGSFPPNPVTSATDMQNVFADVGAPTVDLWTLYQPVVLVQTVRKFSKKRPYACGKCGQCFLSKTSLISHHSSHVTDKVSGCIGCGLLLSSKKVVPRFHVCNSPNNATKFRLITARPLTLSGMYEAYMDRSPIPRALGPRATSSLQLTRQNPSVATQTLTSLQVKNENMGMYNESSQGFHVSLSLQSKGRNPSESKPRINVSLSSRSHSLDPSPSTKSRLSLSVTPSLQLKTPTDSASGLLSNRGTSSAPDGFTCRVCHIPFETAQLLQRHKCARAQEFMAQHVRGGRQHYRPKRMTPVGGPIPAQMNGQRKFGVPAAGNLKRNQVMAVSRARGQGAAPGRTVVDMDDDCYIVESGPEKPAEMIYQVTSSVPIKT